jgi:hypothetical protein
MCKRKKFLEGENWQLVKTDEESRIDMVGGAQPRKATVTAEERRNVVKGKCVTKILRRPNPYQRDILMEAQKEVSRNSQGQRCSLLPNLKAIAAGPLLLSD